MFIVGIVLWWYTDGWKKLATLLWEKIQVTEDYFSIDILLATLFSPYKQISAGSSGRGTFQDQVRDWFDRQFSRFFGALIRLLILIVGVVWLLLQGIVNIAVLILWPLLPALPLVGIVLCFVVGAPSWSL